MSTKKLTDGGPNNPGKTTLSNEHIKELPSYRNEQESEEFRNDMPTSPGVHEMSPKA